MDQKVAFLRDEYHKTVELHYILGEDQSKWSQCSQQIKKYYFKSYKDRQSELNSQKEKVTELGTKLDQARDEMLKINEDLTSTRVRVETELAKREEKIKKGESFLLESPSAPPVTSSG